MMLNTQILPIENEIPIRMNHIFKTKIQLRNGMLKLQTVQINNAKSLMKVVTLFFNIIYQKK